MLAMFSPVFEADTKIISRHDFVPALNFSVKFEN